VTNTLPYYDSALNPVVKSFMAQVTDVFKTRGIDEQSWNVLKIGKTFEIGRYKNGV